jgi:hypothetical protein
VKKSVVVVIALLAALLLGAAWLYGRLFDEKDPNVVARTDAGPSAAHVGPSAQAADGGPTPVSASATTVTAVRGKVEKRGADGAWVALKVGDPLRADEAIRTGRNAEANLAVGNGVTVRLSPRSQFAVREIAEGLSRVRLGQGHVTASVDPTGRRVLRVETPGSDAVAESSGGEFGIVTDGQGQLTVAATTGSVKLKAKGETVAVEAGQTATANAGEVPSAPREIPKSLFVKLADVNRTRTNQPYTDVQGSTDPASVVKIGDQVAQVDDKGKFKVRVPLVDGPNRVSVEVLDAAGRRKDLDLPEIEVDRKKPELETKMQWGGN